MGSSHLSPPGAVLRQLPQAGSGQGRLRPGHPWDEARQGDPEDHFWGQWLGISCTSLIILSALFDISPHRGFCSFLFLSRWNTMKTLRRARAASLPPPRTPWRSAWRGTRRTSATSATVASRGVWWRWRGGAPWSTTRRPSLVPSHGSNTSAQSWHYSVWSTSTDVLSGFYNRTNESPCLFDKTQVQTVSLTWL